MVLLENLKVGDKFQDMNIHTEAIISDGEVEIDFSIVGDHVYTISNNMNTLVVAKDLGKGNGEVLSVTHYNM